MVATLPEIDSVATPSINILKRFTRVTSELLEDDVSDLSEFKLALVKTLLNLLASD